MCVSTTTSPIDRHRIAIEVSAEDSRYSNTHRTGTFRPHYDVVEPHIVALNDTDCQSRLVRLLLLNSLAVSHPIILGKLLQWNLSKMVTG